MTIIRNTKEVYIQNQTPSYQQFINCVTIPYPHRRPALSPAWIVGVMNLLIESLCPVTPKAALASRRHYVIMSPVSASW